MSKSLIFIAIFAILGCTASAEVKVATKDNFDQVIAGDLTLMKFYAPWCGHCKKLAPEYEEASKSLEGTAVLAEVDCTQDKELCDKFDVKGFPTLAIFRKGAKSSDYDGPREAKGIVSYMKSVNSPALRPLATAAELTTLKEAEPVVCLVKTSSATSDMAKVAEAAANGLRGKVVFAVASDAAVSDDAMESITVYRNGNEREVYAGPSPVTAQSLNAFLNDARVPYFGELNGNTFQTYMSANEKKPLGWLFLDKNSDASLKTSLAPIAQKLRDRALLCWIDADQFAQVAKQLAIPEEAKFPAFVMDMNRVHHVMPIDTKITPESINDFVEKYLRGETEVSKQSEAVPAEETKDGLTTVVGKTFDKYVAGEKDVFILFYAPWCGHCKKLHPEYEVVAKNLADKDVVVAQIDATANDFDRSKFDVKGFPTMYFIPAGKAPVTYDGERTTQAIQAFIESHASVKKEAAAPSEEGDL